jgi:hypothetical protein
MSIWGMRFVSGEKHCDEILIMLGRLRFGEDFEVNFAEGYVRRMQCNVGFGHRLSVCFSTEKIL